jgi:hypothetical protein
MTITIWAVEAVALNDMDSSPDPCFFSTEAGAHLYGKETYADRVYIMEFDTGAELPERIFTEDDWGPPC